MIFPAVSSAATRWHVWPERLRQKTPLLKIILGELPPDKGRVKFGTKISVAYFDQLRAQLNDEATLADTISQGSDYVEIEEQKKHVISYLGDFLFAPERARSPVKSCSGGERNRLLLARLFTQPANVLVLDEPTNDLDIETLELLEELLANYDGTLFLVSHDRAFLDNVVTQVIAFEGDGKLIEYISSYEDWVRVTPGGCRSNQNLLHPPAEGEAVVVQLNRQQPHTRGEGGGGGRSGESKPLPLPTL